MYGDLTTSGSGFFFGRYTSTMDIQLNVEVHKFWSFANAVLLHLVKHSMCVTCEMQQAVSEEDTLGMPKYCFMQIVDDVSLLPKAALLIHMLK